MDGIAYQQTTNETSVNSCSSKTLSVRSKTVTLTNTHDVRTAIIIGTCHPSE